jgi:glycerate 2-kinase
MKILIAPNSFRDSLSSFEAAQSIERGIIRADNSIETILFPIADGGDYSLEVACLKRKASRIKLNSSNANGQKINTEYLIFEDGSAFIEMAKISGNSLIKKEERKAGMASSFGTGTLIAHAIKNGCDKIYLAVGGTASTDGGTGILKALGFRFLDINGHEISFGGIALNELTEIRVPKNITELLSLEFHILCDVSNPFLGENGTAKIFAPQKGASLEEVKGLEKGLQNFASIIQKKTGKDLSKEKFFGAAGGTPAGLSAFLKVSCSYGAEVLFKMNGLENLLSEVDMVITGEGSLDEQSLQGKATVMLAEKCRKAGKKIIFIGGKIPAKPSHEINACFDGVFSIAPGPVSLEESIENADLWLENTSFQVMQVLKN